MPAFYDDGTGLCFWCPKPATGESFGVPLCPEHLDEEEYELHKSIGLPG
jgi:hypothetical protein